MGYYNWISDNHSMYCEMKSDREWSGRNYTYSYYFEVNDYPRHGSKHIYFSLPFSSKRQLKEFYWRFAEKFEKISDRRIIENKWVANKVDIMQVIQCIDEVIKELKYSKRKSKKIYENLYKNI